MANPSEPERKEISSVCHLFQAALSDYLEGEARPEVTRHARECPFCAVLLADLETLRTEARNLSWEEPPERLWANVRSRLAEEGTLREPAAGWARWFAGPAWAHLAVPSGALACLALFGAVLLVPPGAVERNSAWLATADRAQAAHQLITQEDDTLVNTISEMEKSYDLQQRFLAPTVRGTYEKGLQSLDDSIRECRASVEQEPGNQLARDMLVSAYTRKAEVLASALKSDVP